MKQAMLYQLLVLGSNSAKQTYDNWNDCHGTNDEGLGECITL